MKDSPPIVHMDALPSGTRLGEFEIQGLLGVGGFGMVYRGYDHSLHRPVAIKEYMPVALVGRAPAFQVSARSSADQLPFQSGLTSFIAEARLLARFDHPSLVKVYRFWEANNTAYMAMPLYSGMTLKQARSLMSGPPPEEWLRTVLWSVLEALRVLHGGHTLHRDVSPDNIFLQDVGPPVLLDLGSARRAITEHSHKHTAVLKVNYAPIEQYADARGLSEGAWTDLYSLAAVVHGCVCNEAPAPATFRVVQDRMPAFSQVAKTAQTHFETAYSAAFCHAIDHALALQPADRPHSVDAFIQELGLQVPQGLAQFNWRLSLGPSITLGDTPTARDRAPTQRLQAQYEQTKLIPTPAGVTPMPQSAKSDLSIPRSRWLWMGALVFGVLVIAVLAYKNSAILQTQKPPAPVPIAIAGGGAGEKERTVDKALCANEPFYKRTLCVYRECQKPGMSKSQACVEDRKRREDAYKKGNNF